MSQPIDFRTSPNDYRHFSLSVDDDVATLSLDVDEDGGLFEGYALKLNSYDLGVDIELADAVNRLRFEHPGVKAVVLTSAKDNVFCAGANIKMLSLASHGLKVNFCKFTNETRFAIEEATEHSRQFWLTALNGPAAGGGYELAAATDHIILIDDSNSAVSLPEVPLLAVLPGTGGLTRLVDKRAVRRDRADVFCTTEEGIRGERAVAWGLIDQLAPKSRFGEIVDDCARGFAKKSDRPSDAVGIRLSHIERTITATTVDYEFVNAKLDRTQGAATICIRGPSDAPPADPAALRADSWAIAAAREFDDLLLHLRFNEAEIGLIVLKTRGDAEAVRAWDDWLSENKDHWLVRETRLLWRRTLKRLELSARTIFCLIDSDSCYAGLLAELAFVADRSYMFEANDGPTLMLGASNFDAFDMANGWSRLRTRFLDQAESLAAVRAAIGTPLDADQSLELGLITESFDDIDWDDEIRIAIEQRASFSADALTAMEANLRFPGPETLETKIFGRLSAWQNWVFQRPNAAGAEGALRRYGTGSRASFDKERI